MHAYPRAARPFVPVLTATVLALAGCGGGGGSSSTPTSAPATATASPTSTATTSSGSGAGAMTLSLSADPTQLKFDKSTLSAKAGKVTIDMKNPASLPHNVAIEGHGVDVAGKIVGKGGTSTVSADLKPGTYTFYCAVDSHRQAGMEGTLTVK